MKSLLSEFLRLTATRLHNRTIIGSDKASGTAPQICRAKVVHNEDDIPNITFSEPYDTVGSDIALSTDGENPNSSIIAKNVYVEKVYTDGIFTLNQGSQDIQANINTASAEKWKTPRTFTFKGDLQGSFTIDGSEDSDINVLGQSILVIRRSDLVGKIQPGEVNFTLPQIQDTGRFAVVEGLGFFAADPNATSPVDGSTVVATEDGNGRWILVSAGIDLIDEAIGGEPLAEFRKMVSEAVSNGALHAGKEWNLMSTRFDTSDYYNLLSLAYFGSGSDTTETGQPTTIEELEIDKYSESNYSNNAEIRNGNTMVGNVFTIEKTRYITKGKVYISKNGSPTGGVTLKLYNTEESEDNLFVPTGSVLATSISLDASNLSTSNQLIEFAFSPACRLVAGTYAMVVCYEGGDSTNFVNVGIDDSNPTHDENYVINSAGNWGAQTGYNLVFYIKGTEFDPGSVTSVQYSYNTTPVLMDSVSENNYVTYFYLGANAANASWRKSVGQSITLSSAKYVTECKAYLRKVGSPTGNMYAKIYRANTTAGSNAIPTGNPVVVSASVSDLNISTGWSVVSFNFPTTYLDSGHYVLVFEHDAGDRSNYITIGVGNNNTHYGNMCYMNSTDSNWNYYNSYDLVFYLYGSTVSFNTTSYVNMPSVYYNNTVSYGNTLDSCPSTTYNSSRNLYYGSSIGMGQTFSLTSSKYLYQVSFYARKVNSPTGAIYAKLYNATGLSGSNGIPYGAPLAVSVAVDATTLSTSFGLVTFTFNPVVSLTSGTYVVTLEYAGGSSSHYIQVGLTTTAGNHTGNGCYLNSSYAWNSLSSDTIFYIYGGSSSYYNYYYGGYGSTYSSYVSNLRETSINIPSSIATTQTGLSGTDARFGIGQSFVLDTAKLVSSVKVNIYKSSAPSGPITAKIYSVSSGVVTSGTAIPTMGAIPIAASVTIEASTLSTASTQVEFSFSNPIYLNSGSYVIMIEYYGAARIYVRNTTTQYSGNLVNLSNAYAFTNATGSMCMELITIPVSTSTLYAYGLYNTVNTNNTYVSNYSIQPTLLFGKELNSYWVNESSYNWRLSYNGNGYYGGSSNAQGGEVGTTFTISSSCNITTVKVPLCTNTYDSQIIYLTIYNTSASRSNFISGTGNSPSSWGNGYIPSGSISQTYIYNNASSGVGNGVNNYQLATFTFNTPVTLQPGTYAIGIKYTGSNIVWIPTIPGQSYEGDSWYFNYYTPWTGYSSAYYAFSYVFGNWIYGNYQANRIVPFSVYGTYNTSTWQGKPKDSNVYMLDSCTINNNAYVSYGLADGSNTYSLGTTNCYFWGQAINLTSAKYVSYLKFGFYNASTVSTGTYLVAKIYPVSGAVGSSAITDGSPLVCSTPVAYGAGTAGTYKTVEFDFPYPYYLNSGQYAVVVSVFSVGSAAAASTTSYIRLQTGTGHYGNPVFCNYNSLNSYAGPDICFELWGYDVDLSSYTSTSTSLNPYLLSVISSNSYLSNLLTYGTYSLGGSSTFSSDLNLSYLTSSSSSKTESTIDTYDLSSGDTEYKLGSVREDNMFSGFGQSFKVSSSRAITKITCLLKRVGTLEGKIYAGITMCTGSSGTDATPYGTPLAMTEGYDVSKISNTDYSEVTFTIDPGYPLSVGDYCFVVLYNGGDKNNYLLSKLDTSSPTHEGNGSFFNGLVWSQSFPLDASTTTGDFGFKVSGTEVTSSDWYKNAGTVYDVNQAVPIFSIDKNPNNTNKSMANNNREYFGPQFELTSAKYIYKIVFPLKKSGAPTGNANVGIFRVNDGVISTTPIAVSNSINVVSLTTTISDVSFVFSPMPYLEDGTYVAALIFNGGSSGNNIAVAINTGIEGTSSWSITDADTEMKWVAETEDVAISIYGSDSGYSDYWEYYSRQGGLVDLYPENNNSSFLPVYATEDNSIPTFLGQSITVSSPIVISKLRFYVRKKGTVTGQIKAKIYRITGVVGIGATGVGEAIAESYPVEASVLTTIPKVIDFAFSIPYQALSDNYVIGIEYTGGDSNNCIEVGVDDTAPTHYGNYCQYNGKSWLADAAKDLIFYMYITQPNSLRVSPVSTYTVPSDASMFFLCKSLGVENYQCRVSRDGGNNWSEFMTPYQIYNSNSDDVIYRVDFDLDLIPTGTAMLWDITVDGMVPQHIKAVALYWG